MRPTYHTFLATNLLIGMGFPALQKKEQNRQISYILYQKQLDKYSNAQQEY